MRTFSSRFIFIAAVLFSWAGAPLAIGAAVADNAPAPDLSVSLRGLLNGAVEAGEPFRVAVRIDAPENAPGGKLILAPAKGSWIDAVSVEILGADGKVLPAVAGVLPGISAEKSATVDAENPASGVWWFPPESLTSVRPGEYSVRARLAVRDGAGWRGETISEPAPLRVITVSTDPEVVLQRKLGRARAAFFAGDFARGAEILHGMLEADPDFVPALMLHAAVSLEGGNRSAARICVDRALVLSTQPGQEPSMEINELAMRIEASSASAAATGGAIPAWTQPPRSVLTPLRTAGATIPGVGGESANRGSAASGAKKP